LGEDLFKIVYTKYIYFVYTILNKSSPKVMREERVAVAQLCNNCNKVPIGYNGTPQIHLRNCSCPFDDHHPI